MSIIKKLLILTLSISLLLTTLLFISKNNNNKDFTNKSVLDICDFENINRNTANCLSIVIKYAIDNNSYKELAIELDKAEAKYADFFGFCHTVTHALGNYAVEKYKDIDTLLSDTTYSTCGGGLSHGALLIYFSQPNVTQEEINLLVEACLKSPNSETCSHGIGHAFASEDDIQSAINSCQEASIVYSNHDKGFIGENFAHSCTYGVLMQEYAPFAVINKEFFIKNKREAADICESFYRNNLTDYNVDGKAILISLFNGCAAGLGFSYGTEVMAKLIGNNIDIGNYEQTLEYTENCTRLSNLSVEFNISNNNKKLNNSANSAREEETKMFHTYGCQIQTLLNTSTHLFKNLDTVNDSTAKDLVTKYNDFCSNFADQISNEKQDLLFKNFYNNVDFNKACEFAAIKNKSTAIKNIYLQLANLL